MLLSPKRARPIGARALRAASAGRLLVAAALISGSLLAARGDSQEFLTQPAAAPALPTVGDPPPMYIADPLNATNLAGIPVGTAADMLPNWPRWFAGARGLVMTRTLPSGAVTMAPAGGSQLTTSSAAATWPGGIDLYVGRWLGPRQQNAIEFIYWGVYGIGSSATATTSPAAITAIPQAPTASVGGTPASAYLQNSASQTISRSDLVNDVEINWVYSLWERPEFLSQDPMLPSRSINLMWLAGFRFFELQDVLTQTSFPGGGAPGTLDLNVATNNNLYGAQVGAKFDWRFMPSVRFTAIITIGSR